MCLYQMYMLVHEMVHFYLGGKGLRLDTRPPEVYSLDGSVELGEGLSLRNPQNWQAFVASELGFLFFSACFEVEVIVRGLELWWLLIT